MEQGIRRIRRKSALTYKQLFVYSLGIIAALLIGGPLLLYYHLNRDTSEIVDLYSQTGQSPETPQRLTAGVNISQLQPSQETWYLYQSDGQSEADFAWVSLTMRYQSEALFRLDEVNFEIIPKKQLPFQLKPKTHNSGALLERTELTELFWSGKVADDELYYIRVYNDSPFALDYTLEAELETPAFSGAIPASFSDTTTDSNRVADEPTRPMNARQLSWFLTAQAVEGMTAEEATAWLRKAQAVGWITPQGVPVQPELLEADADLLWSLAAEAIAGQEADEVLEWLTQADSLGWLAVPPATLKDFSPPPQPITPNQEPDPQPQETLPEKPTPLLETKPAPYAPVSIYPNNPLPFQFVEVNSGRLAPYGVHWYDLSLNDPKDNELIEDLALTLFTTPSDGFIDSRVNFEIFPANQDHVWQRGTPNDMEHFGLGMWLSRDDDDNTGERLWSGSVVDGDRYFVKVRNDSPVVIDYYLYAGDIENAELGNPTLHQVDQGQVIPYVPDDLTD